MTFLLFQTTEPARALASSLLHSFTHSFIARRAGLTSSPGSRASLAVSGPARGVGDVTLNQHGNEKFKSGAVRAAGWGGGGRRGAAGVLSGETALGEAIPVEPEPLAQAWKCPGQPRLGQTRMAITGGGAYTLKLVMGERTRQG